MPYVYIMASKKNGALYIGATADLKKRVYQHKNKLAQAFTNKYNIDKLVYYEIFDNIEDTIRKEKKLKKWNRQWKIELIEKQNSEWEDLYYSL